MPRAIKTWRLTIIGSMEDASLDVANLEETPEVFINDKLWELAYRLLHVKSGFECLTYIASIMFLLACLAASLRYLWIQNAHGGRRSILQILFHTPKRTTRKARHVSLPRSSARGAPHLLSLPCSSERRAPDQSLPDPPARVQLLNQPAPTPERPPMPSINAPYNYNLRSYAKQQMEVKGHSSRKMK